MASRNKDILGQTLHELGRQTLVGLARRRLERFDAPPTSRWILRHSASRRGEFHLLLSDLDFTLVLSKLTPEEIARARRFYQLSRKRIPWLGELEIYSENEFRFVESLMKSVGEKYEFWRNFRKLNWMKTRQVKDRGHLNRKKTERAERKCLSNLGLADAGPDALSLLLKTLRAATPTSIEGIPNSAYFPYLSCWANERPEGVSPEPVYRLTPGEIAVVFCNFPPFSKRDAEVWSGNTDPNKIRRDLSALEGVIVSAALRGMASADPGLVEWRARLLEPFVSNLPSYEFEAIPKY